MLLEPAGDVGDVEEIGLRRAGTKGGDRHAAIAALGPQGFAEVQHEGFARRVRRHVRHRLKGGDRRDVDDPAVTTLQHGREQAVRQFGHRGNVELHEIPHPRLLGLLDRPDPTETGVVHEQLDRDPLRGDRLAEPLRLGSIGEIARDDFRLRAMPGMQFLGKLFEQFFPSGREHQVHAARRQPASELSPDAGGRSGDQCPAIGVRVEHVDWSSSKLSNSLFRRICGSDGNTTPSKEKPPRRLCPATPRHGFGYAAAPQESHHVRPQPHSR